MAHDRAQVHAGQQRKNRVLNGRCVVSTGLDCVLIEHLPGEWWLVLESSVYRGEYHAYGPFRNQMETMDHLHVNHANPGGYRVFPYIDEDGAERFHSEIETARRQKRKRQEGLYD